MKRHPYRIAALVSLVWVLTGVTQAPLKGVPYDPTGVPNDQAAPTTDVTFSKNIAPILQRSCQHCHNPAGGAPMSLITYEQVRPWAKAIKTKTGLGPHAGVM